MKDAPLRECLFLVAGLGVLAWPLALVTGSPKGESSQLMVTTLEAGQWGTDVEVTAAHDFDWVELRRGEDILGRVEGLDKEGEFECLLAEDGETLVVAASFPEGTPETALKLKIWAGAFPEVVLNLWGEGEILEEVKVQFHE